METFSFSKLYSQGHVFTCAGLVLYSPRAGHTIHTHTQVSREEVKEETVWKYIYDLLKIIGSIVVPFSSVYLHLFFFFGRNSSAKCWATEKNIKRKEKIIKK
jgi:hypothetical protein